MNKGSNTFKLMLPSNIIWLRILALFLVYLGHSELRLGGGYGATFFLTLSGYIFTRLFLQDQNYEREVIFSDFLSQRLLKLFPTLTVLVIVSIFTKSALHLKIDFLQVLSVLTFTSNYYNSYYGHPNNGLAHLWSLSVYMQFIILYFIMFQYLKSRKNLTWFFILISLLCLGYRILLVTMHLGTSSYIYNSLETRIDALSIGALLALNIEYFYENNFFSWLKHPLALGVNLVLIYFIGQMTPYWKNSFGFFIHAFLYGLLIYQTLNYNIFLIRNSYYKVLSLLCFWFYFFHPWAFIVGHKLPFDQVWQILMGALSLILSMTAFILFREKFKMIFYSLEKKCKKLTGWLFMNN